MALITRDEFRALSETDQGYVKSHFDIHGHDFDDVIEIEASGAFWDFRKYVNRKVSVATTWAQVPALTLPYDPFRQFKEKS